jgi:hypothetical protein
MSRRYLTYLLWRAGRLPDHRPGFAELTFWISEGAPPVGEVQVTHNVVHHRR